MNTAPAPTSLVSPQLLGRFSELPIGARFQLEYAVCGTLVKTGERSYGKRAGEPLWDVIGDPECFAAPAPVISSPFVALAGLVLSAPQDHKIA